jgi:nucleoside 2-deoxyribosyltransferase
VSPQPCTPDGRPVTPGAVYLAGPSGFFEAGRRWHEEVVVPAVRAAGLVPRDPWAGPSPLADLPAGADGDGPARRQWLREANLLQGRRDLELIDESEAVLASLDGPDVDSGTAVEIGYAFARGRLVVGVRTDLRRCGDNDGASVNLMIETCIADSGGVLHTTLDAAVAFLAARLARGARSAR